VLQHLLSKSGDRINALELENQMSTLREQFRHENLPIDDDLQQFSVDDATVQAYREWAFIRQLNLIKVNKRRTAIAVRDFCRAGEQRSRWLRDELVVDLDLSRYDKQLIEAWELVFERELNELEEGSSDEVQEKSARSVLSSCETMNLPVRPNVIEQFVCRGSFHLLSDRMQIGWHPRFRELLFT
jgi:hypothetical protein